MPDPPARPRYAWTTIALLVPYAVLNTTFPGRVVVYGGGLVIAAAALVVCLRGGLARRQLLLVPARPSPLTIASVAAGAAVAFPAFALVDRLDLTATWPAILAALVSAAGQELYFRGAFLGALRFGLGLTPLPAVLLQAGAFSAWHVRAYFEVSPELATLALAFSFLAGLGSALLALRDGTLLWVMALHALLLVFV